MRQFSKRSCACGKSAVESSTTAVFCAVSVTSGRGRAVNRVDDLLELLVLRQARDRGGLLQRLHLVAVRRGGECDDRDLRARALQLARGLDAVEAGQPV